MSAWQKPYRGMQLNKTHPLAKGLVGCWIVNEGSGDKIFDLAAPNGCGVFVGSPAWIAGGVQTDATPSYIDVATKLSVYKGIGAGPYSIIAGVKVPPGNGTDAGVVAFDAYSPMWYLAGTSYNMGIYGGGFTVSSGLNDGKYHNIAWSRIDTGANKTSVYVDGTLRGIGTHSTDLGVAPRNHIYLGWNGYLTQALVGRIYYIHFYHRALSSTEIAWLHREPYAMFEAESPGGFLYVAAGGGVSMPVVMLQMDQFDGGAML